MEYMPNTPYTSQYKPLSPWAYFGYNLLFSIPVVGFILLIVFSCSNSNINRRNYARSFFCALLIAVIILVFFFAMALIFGFSSELMDALQDILP